MPMETHDLMDGKLHVYRRENSRFWQCSTYLNGRNHRATTKEENVVLAKEYAKEWYLERYVEASRTRRTRLLSRHLALPLEEDVYSDMPIRREPQKQKRVTPNGPTFRQACEKFLAEYEVITEGQRNEEYVKSHEMRIRVHLLPFFGDKALSEINAGLVQEYRVSRRTNSPSGKPPSRSALHHDTVTLRLILKTAHRYGWIDAVPDISPPYKTSGKVTHRAWFSPDEYKMLYEATRERAKNPKKERWRGVCEDLHDYVLFMANTGLRPDEAGRLEYRDVTIVNDPNLDERILEIEVRGKRGVGYCKSMAGAVLPFQRMMDRHKAKPTDKIFGGTPRDLLNSVLDELNMKFDRDGNVRTAYSLRHTYICLRLMEGADIYQIAKNCRTSVEMIEKYYAAHLKNTLDTSAINVRKSVKKPKKTDKSELEI
ncbi:MAG: site-specific integrase [Alphaproteobacteria bacterium]|nr:site-specific integrase [Alphaproteobacteria bacterium]